MEVALARPPYATLVPVGVAATIFATALGSSSVPDLAEVGRPLRWVALFALLVAAGLWAAARRVRLEGQCAVLAAGGWLLALAAVSSLWSVEPRLTFERTVSLALLLAAAGLLALAVAGRPALAERLLHGVLLGAAAVTLAGLPLLAVDRGAAVRAATYGVPARYQGLGESPNTVPLLLAVAVPLAVWVALTRRRLLGLALLLLFVGSLAASASRGGLIGALAGSLVVVALCAPGLRRAAALAIAACVVFVAATAVGRIPEPVTRGSTSSPAGQTASPHYRDAEAVFPLADDVGRPLPGRGDNEGARTLLGSSGRTTAWAWAVGHALDRPFAGFGFGSEDRVFVDRFANFEGGRVESSYIGMLLQLGVVGLASLLLVPAAAAVAGRRALRARGPEAAAAGAVAGGLVVALVQSYLYSAGNIAALSFWLAVGVVAAGARRAGLA